jgi:molybdate transport system ATP-binding protein
MIISVKHDFGQRQEFQLDVDLNLEEGKVYGVFGESGSGKSSFLRIIAGLEKPVEAEIVFKGRTFYKNSKADLAPELRNCSMVFQQYLAFENMTVFENLKFSKKEKVQSGFPDIDELLDHLELADFRNQKAANVSGGQRQRLALARALMAKPDLLLLDEPFSAQHHTLRKKLQQYLLDLQKRIGFTVFIVSHQLTELLLLAENMMIMDAGRVLQFGSPRELFMSGISSSRFSLQGEVIDIHQRDIVWIATVLVSGQLVEVVLDPNELQSIGIGDQVLVSAKAFNPSVKKLS